MTEDEVQEIVKSFELSDALATRVNAAAAQYGVHPSEAVEFLVRWAMDRVQFRPAIAPQRGQRPDAKADPRLDWWREAKFGMFIHWGLYAIPAGTWKGEQIRGIGEWIMYRAQIPVAEYEKLAEQFNPVKFDAKEWVGLAKRAGQKYLTITSKHHDGFCLFGSEHTDYNIVDGTPFKRDVLKELAEECEKQGIKLCFYYSQTQDWHHPNGDGNEWDYDPAEKDFDAYVETYVKLQVTELLTNYGPIGLIWFDTPKAMSLEQSQELTDLVHELQPDCLVSGRIGNQMGDYASSGDNRIPETAVDADWEVPATLNDTWGFKSYDHNWKSSKELIRKLVDIVSKGGNYLLNVGPTAEGVIPEPSVVRLEAMGAWLEVNGEAIYGTTPGPIQGVDGCRSTRKGNTVYLHVFDWPADGKLVIPEMDDTVTAAALLVDPETPLTIGSQDSATVVTVPAAAPDEAASVVALTVA